MQEARAARLNKYYFFIIIFKTTIHKSINDEEVYIT